MCFPFLFLERKNAGKERKEEEEGGEPCGAAWGGGEEGNMCRFPLFSGRNKMPPANPYKKITYLSVQFWIASAGYQCTYSLTVTREKKRQT